MESKKIKLGVHCGENVFFDAVNASNFLNILLGVSGSGKSTEGEHLCIEHVKNGDTVIALDIHNIFAPDQIYKPLRADFNKYLHNVDVYNDGLPMKLFTPAQFEDGDTEKSGDTIEAITDAISKAFKLGVRQKATLRSAVKDVAINGRYKEEGIAAVGNSLEEASTAKSFEVAERISQITEHNVFVDGDLFIKPGKINVIRLSKYSFDTQRAIVEVILNLLWRMASHGEFKESGVYIFADEFQNFDMGKNSILSQILREGRKYNLNLILSTQVLSQSAYVTKFMMQASLIMFFQPSKSEVATVARILDPGREEDWIRVLNHLQVGEFIAYGAMEMNGTPVKKPLKVTAEFENKAIKSAILGGNENENY